MAKNPARSAARPPNQAHQAPQQHHQIIGQAQHWAGPLPPPGALAQFNDIIPNGAERIMAMVEQEQANRIEHDQLILTATIKDTRRGHWIGGAISLGAIAAAVYTAHIGAHPTVSVALVGLPLVAIIQAIVRSKSNNK